jgi:hypothetical protein
MQIVTEVDNGPRVVKDGLHSAMRKERVEEQ